jgi:hypothetical protein
MQIELAVETAGVFDAELADRLARGLRAELAELDVDSVTLAGGVAPDCSKSADAVTIGALVVALSASGGVFTALIQMLRDWLGRQADRHRCR